jgi:hypothetical protein
MWGDLRARLGLSDGSTSWNATSAWSRARRVSAALPAMADASAWAAASHARSRGLVPRARCRARLIRERAWRTCPPNSST